MNALPTKGMREFRFLSPVSFDCNLSSLLDSATMLSAIAPEEYLSYSSSVNSGHLPQGIGVDQPWRLSHPEVGVEVEETVLAEVKQPAPQKFAKVVFRAELTSPYRAALY